MYAVRVSFPFLPSHQLPSQHDLESWWETFDSPGTVTSFTCHSPSPGGTPTAPVGRPWYVGEGSVAIER